MVYGYIYVITNLVNNKVYVGQTKREPTLREQEHFRGCHNKALNADIHLLGKKAFTFQVVDTAKNVAELSEKERYWISKVHSVDNVYGYNLARGGCGPTGFSWSKFSKQLVSEQRSQSRWFHNESERHLVRPEHIKEYENNPLWISGYGPGRKRKPDSEETKRLKSEQAKKHIRTSSQINKQRESLKRRKGHWYTNGDPGNNILITEGNNIPEGYIRGRSVTDEQRHKCGLKNICRTPRNKKV